MTALEHLVSLDRDALHASALQACARIAPTWPLDRMIAVNPLWERREQPWHEVAQQLWLRAGSRLTLSTEDYRQAWQEGSIAERHLHQALTEQGVSWTSEHLLQALDAKQEPNGGLPLLEDLAEPGIPQPGWPVLITQQIGQCCAAWFDREQADWRPDDSAGLYQAWRSSMLADRGLSVLSACRDLDGRIAELPLQPQVALEAAVQRLGLTADDWAPWFDCLLLRSLGWASWCAYQRWQARQPCGLGVAGRRSSARLAEPLAALAFGLAAPASAAAVGRLASPAAVAAGRRVGLAGAVARAIVPSQTGGSAKGAAGQAVLLY